MTLPAGGRAWPALTLGLTLALAGSGSAQNLEAYRTLAGQLDAAAAGAGQDALSTLKRLDAAQVALAWLLAQGDDIVPIPGSKRRATMEDSAKAPDVTLTAADLAALDAAAPRGGTAGPRYGDARMLAMTRL